MPQLTVTVIPDQLFWNSRIVSLTLASKLLWLLSTEEDGKIVIEKDLKLLNYTLHIFPINVFTTTNETNSKLTYLSIQFQSDVYLYVLFLNEINESWLQVHANGNFIHLDCEIQVDPFITISINYCYKTSHAKNRHKLLSSKQL